MTRAWPWEAIQPLASLGSRPGQLGPRTSLRANPSPEAPLQCSLLTGSWLLWFGISHSLLSFWVLWLDGYLCRRQLCGQIGELVPTGAIVLQLALPHPLDFASIGHWRVTAKGFHLLKSLEFIFFPSPKDDFWDPLILPKFLSSLFGSTLGGRGQDGGR